MTVGFDSDYHIKDNPDTLGVRDIQYKFDLIRDNGEYIITNIETASEDYQIFKERLEDYQEEENWENSRLYSVNSNTALEKMMQETDEIADTLENLPEEELKDNLEDQIMPMAVSVSYNSSYGTSYANKYYKNKAPFFYTAKGGDCTNFVSQCIWAAYGGWKPGQSTATIQTNIKNKKRMVSGKWYGGPGGGAPAWENVMELWNFATANKGNGPRATGYNNGKKYTGVSAGSISIGNVLQLKKAGTTRYAHSIYVTNIVAPVKYSSITIVQHSGNEKRALLDKIKFYGSDCLMRRMAFKSTTFSK